MDILPIEVLENIFGRLSQKFAASVASIVCKKWNQIILQSSFYTSIRILTEQQLIKFIQMANEKTINNQPIGYYVQQLKLDHHINIKEDTLIKLMKVFPNIHFISGLSYQSYKSDSIYPHLNQLTHFSCWYKNKQWTDHLIYNKEIVKSLDININKDMFRFNSQYNPHIHFNLIDNKNLKINWNLPVRLLVLPTFINLIKLNINLYRLGSLYPLDPFDNDFESINSFGIDERTFESIHSSCPQLTVLTISDIIMVISKEFHDQSFIPAHQLKELHLHGTFIDPSCYTYFLKKYSHLDSFFINVELQPLINDNDNRSFQLAITRMLFQFTALKSVSIGIYVPPGENSCESLVKFKKYWPHDEFLMWLKQHSEQITHIEYPCDFTSNDGINIELLQQPTFLTYLTSLSLYLDSAVHLVSTYILQNMDHSIIISTFLKTLTIYQRLSYKLKNFYIYDFLTVFPNLESLQLHSIRFMYDELGDMFQSDDRWECTKLHHMIQRQLSDTDTTVLNNKNENDTCKLKHLKIVECDLFFGYGLNDFFKKCYQLKSLDLLNIKYVISTSDTTSCAHYVPPTLSFLHRICSEELYFDLSHLYFERILISKFYCTPWVNCDKEHLYLVNKLIINETLPGRELILNENINNQSPYQCTGLLLLKCKYIDELIFNK
ncbi:unnamed protein product [Cunninghamella echinulata]